jgi:superfamily II DNA helicase RecQ|eukprot:gene7345-5286_t
MSGDDLSDYERLRLENIRRNAEFLAGLGLQDVLPTKAAVVKEKVQAVGKRKREDFETRKALEQPMRRSRRVQLLQEGLKLSQVDDDNEEIEVKSEPEQRSYEDMPFDSNELDDFEFQVFVALKAWRLRTSRELDIEPYKICQNRTLAELVRRRRNDSSWAMASKSETDRECDLLECWGIGPSKAKQDGFGDLLMKEIDVSDHLEDYLAKSRLNGDNFPTPSKD